MGNIAKLQLKVQQRYEEAKSASDLATTAKEQLKRATEAVKNAEESEKRAGKKLKEARKKLKEAQSLEVAKKKASKKSAIKKAKKMSKKKKKVLAPERQKPDPTGSGFLSAIQSQHIQSASAFCFNKVTGTRRIRMFELFVSTITMAVSSSN